MTRPSDPPGVTYQGGGGVYTVRLHGRIVGTVWRGIRHTRWIAHSTDRKQDWSGVNRGEAVAPLIAWIEAGRP